MRVSAFQRTRDSRREFEGKAIQRKASKIMTVSEKESKESERVRIKHNKKAREHEKD